MPLLRAKALRAEVREGNLMKLPSVWACCPRGGAVGEKMRGVPESHRARVRIGLRIQLIGFPATAWAWTRRWDCKRGWGFLFPWF